MRNEVLDLSTMETGSILKLFFLSEDFHVLLSIGNKKTKIEGTRTYRPELLVFTKDSRGSSKGIERIGTERNTRSDWRGSVHFTREYVRP